MNLPSKAFECLNFQSPLVAQRIITSMESGLRLEQMTCLYDRLDDDNPQLIWTTSVVGKQFGLARKSFYGQDDMWSCLNPLKPHLGAITTAFGRALHLLVATDHSGDRPLRYPLLLIETADINIYEAQDWSHSNQRAAKQDVDPYLHWVEQRNRRWLEATGINDEPPLSWQLQEASRQLAAVQLLLERISRQVK